jgi:hypothetical protein
MVAQGDFPGDPEEVREEKTGRFRIRKKPAEPTGKNWNRSGKSETPSNLNWLNTSI